MRFVAEMVTRGKPARKVPLVVTQDMGTSEKFKCSKCEEEFESLSINDFEQGKCPKCETVNEPIEKDIDFPRATGQFDSPEPAINAVSPDAGKVLGKN